LMMAGAPLVAGFTLNRAEESEGRSDSADRTHK
jgi:hypothetical protein